MTIAMDRTAVVHRSGRYPDTPIEPTDWRSQGHCTRSVLEFIPTVGLGGRVSTTTAAQREQCTGCPVQAWCALSALKQVSEFGTLDGVWAGHAASLTMSLTALNALLASLGRMAGLPDDHYLVLPDQQARRRAHAAALSAAGHSVEAIARLLDRNLVTIKRDLDAVAVR